MQPRDFSHPHDDRPQFLHRHKMKNADTRIWQYFLVVSLLMVCLLMGLWFFNSGLSSALLPAHPQVMIFLPHESQKNPISHLGIVILHRDIHRTSGTQLTLNQAVSPINENDSSSVRKLSLDSGILINQIIQLPSGKIDQQSIRWVLFKLAVDNWRDPQKALEYVKWSFMIPELQERSDDNFTKWGQELVKQVRPLESRSKSCIIGVSNAVGLAGLGKQYADFLALQGATVKRVTNANTILPSSQVLIDESSRMNCAEMKLVVEDLLSAGVPITHQAEVTDKYRVSMMILLGNDITEPVPVQEDNE